MSARCDRAICIIEHLGCCRTKEHSPESTRMSRHDDEIEPCSGNFSDLCCRISGNEDSWVFRDRKLSVEEGIEPVAADHLMFFCDLRGPSHEVKFEAVVAGGVKDVDQRNSGGKQSRSPFYVRSHSDAGWREVHRKEDVSDQPHVYVPRNSTQDSIFSKQCEDAKSWRFLVLREISQTQGDLKSIHRATTKQRSSTPDH